MGNQQCVTGLKALEEMLAGSIAFSGPHEHHPMNIDAIVEALGPKLAESLREILGPVMQDTSSDGAEVHRSLLMELLENVKHIRSRSQQLEDELAEVKRLSLAQYELLASLEADANRMPCSFILLPEAAVADDLDANAATSVATPSQPPPPPPPPPLSLGIKSRCAKLAEFVNSGMTKYKKRACRLLWKKSRLVFVCPVTLKRLQCGPPGGDGRGYEISIPKTILRQLFPVLRWGLFVLRVALTTQGAGGVVAPFEELLKSCNLSLSSDSLAAVISQVEADCLSSATDTADSKLASSMDGAAPLPPVPVDPASAAHTKQALYEIFQLLQKAEGKVSAEDWNTGLHLVTPKAGTGKSAWVSDEGRKEFEEKGAAAMKCVQMSIDTSKY